MYTKEELEGMKFKHLKSIAKQNKISRRLTTKREIIDSLLNFEQEENLDDITVTLLNNSEVEESAPPTVQSKVEGNLHSGKENEPEVVGRTRTVRRKFPKPRMTVFQMCDADDQSVVIQTSQSRKGNCKYFAEPGSTKTSKVNEDLNTSPKVSAKSNASLTLLHDDCNEIQNSKLLSSKKQNRTSAKTRRRFPKPRMTINEMFYGDGDQSVVILTNQSAKDAGNESHKNENYEPQMNLARQGRYFKNSSNDVTMKHSSAEDVVNEANAGDKDTQLNETFEIEQQNIDKVHKSGRKNKISAAKLRRSTRRKTVMSSTKGNNKVSTLKDAQEVSPQLNETFELEEQDDVTSDFCKSEVSSRKKRKSVRKKAIVTSSPKDAQEESPQLNETFEVEQNNTSDIHTFEVSSSKIRKSARKQAIMSPRDLSIISLPEENKVVGMSNFYVEPNQIKQPVHENEMSFRIQKDNKNGKKRRSRSCQPETRNRNDSQLHFFSPLSKSITKPKDSSKKGTPVKNTRIPKFIKQMPDFQNIHKKQFEKMESLVENHQRRQERAKGLLSPPLAKNSVMVFTARPTVKQSPIKKPVTQIPGLRIATKQNILTDHNAPPPAQPARNNVVYNKEYIKEIISRKLPVQDRRENVRQQSRTTIRGVRLNRRFELQMAHRKIN